MSNAQLSESGVTGEYAAFLGAICDAPKDDAPRLVFADWLDEHGQSERAELIRLTIEERTLWRKLHWRLNKYALSEGCRVGCPACRRNELRGRLGGSSMYGVDNWKLCGLSSPPPENVSLTTTCGFCDDVWAPFDWWMTNGEMLLRQNPIGLVRLLQIPDPPGGSAAWSDAWLNLDDAREYNTPRRHRKAHQWRARFSTGWTGRPHQFRTSRLYSDRSQYIRALPGFIQRSLRSLRREAAQAV